MALMIARASRRLLTSSWGLLGEERNSGISAAQLLTASSGQKSRGAGGGGGGAEGVVNG